MPDLTLDTAQTLTAAALRAGRERGLKPLCVAVYDARGALKSFAAEDGTALRRGEIARGKANGALALGLGSRALAERAEAQAYFVAAVSHVVGPDGLVPVPGGVLIRDGEGRLLGTIGISGDTSDNDEACAVAGIEAAGFSVETGG